jgi:hypothetical protein
MLRKDMVAKYFEANKENFRDIEEFVNSVNSAKTMEDLWQFKCRPDHKRDKDTGLCKKIKGSAKQIMALFE